MPTGGQAPIPDVDSGFKTQSGLDIMYEGWVQKVRPDPRDRRRCLLVEGMLGKSELDGHIRVFRKVGLGRFLDIPVDQILHFWRGDRECIDFSMLLVRRDAVVHLVDHRFDAPITRPIEEIVEGFPLGSSAPRMMSRASYRVDPRVGEEPYSAMPPCTVPTTFQDGECLQPYTYSAPCPDPFTLDCPVDRGRWPVRY